jgi:hypothetical protein
MAWGCVRCVSRGLAPREENSVAVELGEHAAVDRRANRPLEEERSRAADGPISARGSTMWAQVVGCRVCEGEALEGEARHGAVLGARGVDEDGEHRRDDAVRRRRAARIVPQPESGLAGSGGRLRACDGGGKAGEHAEDEGAGMVRLDGRLASGQLRSCGVRSCQVKSSQGTGS